MRSSIGMMAISVLLSLTACQGAYYGALEKVGIHKRDVLVDRVEKARDEQEATKEQFVSALEQFAAVVEFEGGDIERAYKTLDRELQRSEARASAVHERIAAVEEVAAALFKEWEKELDDYASANLRRSSEEQLRDTRQRYGQLIDAMHRAESKIEPVLTPMRDQVLYLKHNLNARAIAAIGQEVGSIEGEVAVLIRDMEAAIAEADSFIKAMDQV